MKIRELFEKPIDRFIEGVIKADDDRNLIDEMDEYIITKDISKKLRPILENYSNNPKVNGVWISGFFGSGKSHLLKMLSMAMERKTIEGKDLSEIFLEKIRETNDEFLIGDMEKTLEFPVKVSFSISIKKSTQPSRKPPT